ncbi:MAG: ACT domain-containing protein [Firmicutes bacterium]|nr:ACT domain-containing protein [Bacillota bacterium]MBQ5960568.1 ACT domain-containing protein [Bacillota bacterium]
MKGIITVVGEDHVGIIAGICTLLAESNVNVLDISQSITGGYFHMMMVVDMEQSDEVFHTLDMKLTECGKQLGVQVKLQSDTIFRSMHRI